MTCSPKQAPSNNHREVKTIEDALQILHLPADRQVIDLNTREMSAFR